MQRMCTNRKCFVECFVGDGCRNLLQRQMCCDQRHAQSLLACARSEHHDHAVNACKLLEKFGVSCKRNACFYDDAFLHWSRYHCAVSAVLSALCGATQGFDDVGGVGNVKLPGHGRMRKRHVLELHPVRKDGAEAQFFGRLDQKLFVADERDG